MHVVQWTHLNSTIDSTAAHAYADVFSLVLLRCVPRDSLAAFVGRHVAFVVGKLTMHLLAFASAAALVDHEQPCMSSTTCVGPTASQ
jgi:hypothetical protein